MEKRVKVIVFIIIALSLVGCGPYHAYKGRQAAEQEADLYKQARDTYTECLKNAKDVLECEREKAIFEAYRRGIPVEVKVDE